MPIQVDVFDDGNDILRVIAVVPKGDPRAAGTDLADGGQIIGLGWVSALNGLTTPQKKAYITGLLKATRPEILSPRPPSSPASGSVSYTI